MIYTSYIRLYVERISSDARKVGEISERAKSADSAAKRVFRFRGVRRVKREKGKKGKIAGLTCSGKHTIGDEREKISVEEGGRDGANDARSRVGTGGREDRKNIGRSGINRFQRRGSFVKRTAIVAECSREMFCNSPEAFALVVSPSRIPFSRWCLDPNHPLSPPSIPILINPPMTFSWGRIVIGEQVGLKLCRG